MVFCCRILLSMRRMLGAGRKAMMTTRHHSISELCRPEIDGYRLLTWDEVPKLLLLGELLLLD